MSDLCQAPIRYFLPGAVAVVEPCARPPHETGRHRTATAQAALRRKARAHEAKYPERARAAKAAQMRRRYRSDPEYRRRQNEKSAKWRAAHPGYHEEWAAKHPLQVMLYQVNAHAAKVESALEELC